MVLVAGDVEAENLKGGGVGIWNLDDPEVGAADPPVVDHVVVLRVLLAKGLETGRIHTTGQLDLVLEDDREIGDGARAFLVDALPIESDVGAVAGISVAEAGSSRRRG